MPQVILGRGLVFVSGNRTSKQMEQEAPSLFGHVPARSRLKSIKDFLTCVKPSYFPLKAVRCNTEEIMGQVALRSGQLQ